MSQEITPRPQVEPATPVEPVAAAPVAAVGPAYNLRLVLAIWFVTGVVDVIVGLRFLMKALGASTVSAFTTFVYGLSDPLVGPFRGIFPESAHQTFMFEPADLVALIIYALIGWGLVTLVRILTSPRSRRPLLTD